MGDALISKWDEISGYWYWYSSSTIYIKATQILHPFKVETPDDVVEGKSGDYLVEVARGMRYLMSRAEFEKLYTVMHPARRI